MGRKVLLFCLMLVLAISVMWAGCAAPTPAPAEESLKIGVFVSYTGDVAHYGPKVEAGMKIRLDELNWKIAGRPVELIIEDDGSYDTVKTVASAKKLMDVDKCDIFIGPITTPGYKAVLPLFNETRQLCITLPWRGGIIPWEEGKENWIVLASGALAQITYPAGEWAYKAGYRTVATIGGDFGTAYNGIGAFCDAFTKAGGKVVQQQWPPHKTMDLGPYITKLEEADITIACAFGPMMLALIKQYHEYGLWDKQPLIILPNDTCDENALADLGDWTIGMKAATPYTYLIDNPINKKFVASYEAMMGEPPPSDVGMQGYVNMCVVNDLIEATGGDITPEVLRNAVQTLVVEGPAGTLKFTKGGYPTVTVHVSEVQKKGDKLVWEIISTASNVDLPGVYEKP